MQKTKKKTCFSGKGFVSFQTSVRCTFLSRVCFWGRWNHFQRVFRSAVKPGFTFLFGWGYNCISLVLYIYTYIIYLYNVDIWYIYIYTIWHYLVCWPYCVAGCVAAATRRNFTPLGLRAQRQQGARRRWLSCGGFLEWGTPKPSILIGCFTINHPFWVDSFMETLVWTIKNTRVHWLP